jgi:hypothetical protein
LSDELAIRRVLASYCHRIDGADFAGVAQLFSADGSFRFFRSEPTGHEALAAYFAEMQPPHRRGRHIAAEPVVDVDGDRASARSSFLFVRWVDGSLAIEVAGDYVDELVRDGSGWRIRRRDVEVLRKGDDHG